MRYSWTRTPCALALAAGIVAMAAPMASASAAETSGPMPHGGLEGEALEAAREGADGDAYVDPDRDPTNDAELPWGDDTESAMTEDMPVGMDKDRGLLGDGEIVIEDGEVTEGLIDLD